MKNKLCILLALVVALGVASVGTSASLKIGDPAPKLQESSWVQGEPVKGFETGKVYVVEFWATWCGPCRASIPHLNAMYQKYKDKEIVVIGQDVWEQEDSGVAPFVKKMGTNMTYRVAMDDKSHEEKGAMAVNWMEAAGLNGIPSAFIVNKQGKIAWIGHPMTMTEKLWDDILSDHYDLGKAKADYEKEQAGEGQMQQLQAKLNAAAKAEKWDDALATVDEMEKAMPDDTTTPEMIRMQIFMKQKKYDDAYRVAGAVSGAHADNAELQNAIAWMLVSESGAEKRDTALVQKIAERANTAAGGKAPAVLDTLARAQFMNGKKDEAIATQQKAVDLAEGPEQVALKLKLNDYQAGKLPDAQQH